MKNALVIRREMRTGDRSVKGVTAEHCRPGAGGRALNISRAGDSPRGEFGPEMVFRRGPRRVAAAAFDKARPGL